MYIFVKFRLDLVLLKPGKYMLIVFPLRKQSGCLCISGVSSGPLCAAALEGYVQTGGADGRDDSLLQ